MKLNDYIENIRKDGEYAGIIEISIATKLFSINIFVYKEETSIMDKYILHETIDTDNNIIINVIYYLKRVIIFSILLDKTNLNSKGFIWLKRKVSKSKIIPLQKN